MNFLKSVEHIFRKALIGALGYRKAGSGMDFRLPARPRFLLVRTDRLGDAVVSTPLINILRNRYPDARIDLVLGARNASVAPLLVSADNLYILAKSPYKIVELLHRFRNMRYDCAINLVRGPSTTATIVTAVSRAKVRIGFGSAGSAPYTHTIPFPPDTEHIVRQTTRLLSPLGIPPVPHSPGKPEHFLRLSLKGTCSDGDRVVFFNISGSQFSRSFWGHGQYTQTITRLMARGYRVIVGSALPQAGIARRLATGAGCAVCAPVPNITEYAARIAQACILVTPDTSVTHIGAAMGLRVVLLTDSPSVTSQWYPWGVPNRVLFSPRELGAITSDQVVNAIEELSVADTIRQGVL